MPAGRPPIWDDGDYPIGSIKDCLEDSFQSEKDLCDFIELNIDKFVKDCLGLELKSYKREYPLFVKAGRKVKGNRRIDFLIFTRCGKRIGIECKKPSYDSELSSGIGQILSYIALFDSMDFILDKVVLLSTKVDYVIPLVISKFNLPIDYICMDKNKHLTLKKP